MKKIMKFAAISLAVAGLFVSCASTGKNDAFVSSAEHPRTYVIDIADAKGGSVTKFSSPQQSYFGGNTMDFSDFLKYDPPRMGDTFEVHYKGVSDIDLPGIELCISNHSTWNNLITQAQCELSFHDNIKAGEVFEGVKTYVLDGTAPSAKAAISFDFYYDNCLMNNNGYAKVGKAATIKWEKTGVETTNTALDAGEIVTRPEGALTFNINIADAMKMVSFEVGDANGAEINNFKAFINVTDCPEFKYYLPKKGDTVNFTFKGTSDTAIETPIIYALVDQSEAAGWWKEVGAANWSVNMADSIPANEEFTITSSMELSSDCIGGLTIFALYNNFDGARSATWIYSRN